MTLIHSHNPAKKTRRQVERFEGLTLAPLLTHTNQTQLARRSGVALRTVNRDARRPLTIERASLYADTLRVNPATVWPAWVGILEAQRKAEVAARRRESRRRAPAAVRQREREYARRYQHEARRAVSMKQRQWREEHVEQVRDYDRAYRAANRERIRQRQKDYYQANAERMRALQRERDLRRRAKKAA